MSSALYRPWLKTDRGYPLTPLDKHLGLVYTKTVNGPGWFTISYPVKPGDFKDPKSVQNLLAPDRQIQVWRKPTDGVADYLDFVGFVRRWNFSTAQDGATVLTISGPDQNDLLQRRIVAYASGTDQAKVSETSTGYFADEAMVDLINENLAGGATDTDRDITDYGFSFGWSPKGGPDVRKAFAWRNVLKVLNDLNAASKTAGSEVFFRVNVSGIDGDGSPILHFGAFNGPIGGNRSWTAQEQSSAAMIFGLKWGNLFNPSLTYDYSKEINYVYVGGPGEGTMREIVERSDVKRISNSVFNRREAFVDARQQSTTEQLQALGDEELNRGRPIVIFSGTILSTEQTPYGDGWDLGSNVTIEYEGLKFNGNVKNLQVTVLPDGSDNVQSNIEYESAI